MTTEQMRKNNQTNDFAALSSVLSALMKSFLLQSQWYDELNAVTQRMIGQLAISRGDVMSIMKMMEEKKTILEQISHERQCIGDAILVWERHKLSMSQLEQAQEFQSVITGVEQRIQMFMEREEQLTKQLEYIMASSQKDSQKHDEYSGR